MPQPLGEFKFHSPGIFAGETGTIDATNHVIRGVSVITGGIEAEGHDLLVDSTTLKQLQSCAKDKGKIPVSLDHGSGVKDLNGYLTGFRMDGDKLRADWHLLATHDETEKMMERAEKMPECFGLSVAFKGPPKGVPVGGGKMAARCEKLLSVDCVTRPAANVGLFSTPSVDTPENDMAKATAEANKNAAPPAEEVAGLKEVLDRLEAIGARLDQHEQFINQAQEPTLEDLYNASEEELAAINQHYGTDITRDQINAAVEEYVASAEAQNTEAGKTGEGNEAAAVGAVADTGISGGADMSAPATFQALTKRIVQLEQYIVSREKAEEEAAKEHQMKSIDEKIVTLGEKIKTYAENEKTLKAENEALRLAVRTGTRPVKAGVDEGVRAFGTNGDGKLHEFQVRVKQFVAEGKTDAQAIRLAQKENPGLHADWVMSLRSK